MKIYVYLLIGTCLWFGCSKKDSGLPLDQPTSSLARKEFVIRKGNHYADGDNFELMTANSIHCKVIFDSSAIYESIDKTNQEDVNKLIGFSDCNTLHHENSARLGWSWNGHAVVLYAYAYVAKERMIKMLNEVKLNQQLTCSVAAKGNQYFFTANNVVDSLPRYCADYSGQRYKLFPYFGGDETAPHDIKILITE